jgi:hypothetical protein
LAPAWRQIYRGGGGEGGVMLQPWTNQRGWQPVISGAVCV